MESRQYFIATAAVYAPCLIFSSFRITFEYGLGRRAELQKETDHLLRVTIPANFGWQPGQDCFLRFPGIGLEGISSCSFTICSLPSPLIFYVRPQYGLTRKFYTHAMEHPEERVAALVHGPYGGIDDEQFFFNDRILIVAGGSGAAWMLPLVERSLQLKCRAHRKRLSDKSTTQKEWTDNGVPFMESHRQYSVRVVLANRNVPAKAWFLAALNNLLTEDHDDSGVEVNVFLTGEKVQTTEAPFETFEDQTKPIQCSVLDLASASGEGPLSEYLAGVDEKTARGRPDCSFIIRQEAKAAVDAGWTMGVYCCGPLSM